MGTDLDKYKIGFFADGPWSHLSLNKLLLDHDLVISFVCGRYQTSDNVLKKICQQNHIPFITSKNINNKKFLMKIKEFSCDLFVSMSFNQIFKNDIISMPKSGIINCHAGNLPFYRGRNVLNWVLINDEKEFGITVHYVDSGIDTGDIIRQNTYQITDDDDYHSLLKVAYVECTNILNEVIYLFANHLPIPRKSQSDIHPIGFYCSQRKNGDEIIDWNLTSREIFNFVRSICVPGPVARTYINGSEVMVHKVELIPNGPIYKGIPGAVLNCEDNEVVVKTQDSTIKFVEYEANEKIKVGCRFE